MAWIKRIFDVAGALGGLVAFSPIMAAIVVAIWVDDGRPILFRQERVGLGRRPFTLLKFRSMRGGEVTRVGRVLRATGLDELPQFINILRGDMSAVGPRPLTADDVQRLGWATREVDDRWSVRPGLTGVAQLRGTRSAGEALTCDRHYIANRTLWLDCRLVAWSFIVNAVGKARVRAALAKREPRHEIRRRGDG